ncbi:ABC transporter ATP-binding protein [Aliirhizobium smilacinae]|uniref:ABC transporter ATP-binding protein n=1 Tax=Aliirhizobium smilacinae TaxID=1395944 RepID=A0A5C4XIW1_9HYPH|nr:ABC transporter ATP-binding protein [Rhizobium smilacinae]TNM63455.1 ABC transporter ATP-binding protein [Rhizobium smilacinae]
MASYETGDVVLTAVEKCFGDSSVVKGIDLTIRKGEFFSLLGPSGCGKTTTLRMIAGLEEPTSGSISIRGERMNGVPINKRPTNLVFQKLALFPHLNVWDNVAFGLKLKRVPEAEIRTRVGEMLDMVRLSGFESRSIASLSGGQQQRVAIARAVVNKPAVLLLDEPLGALDLKLQTHLQEELRRIQRELAMTFVYVTHNQTEAMAMSDRIGVMNAGQLEQVGAAADLYLRPQTEFVAGFVGQTNLIGGKVTAIGETTISIEAFGLTFDAVRRSAVETGQAVTFSLRPEQIRIAQAGGAGIQLPLVDATFFGATATYRLQVPGGTIVAQTQGDLQMLAPGQTVSVSWPPEAVVLLTGGQS